MNTGTQNKSIKNPKYIRFSRIAFYSGVFVVMPLTVLMQSNKSMGWPEWATLAFYIYLIVGNYILGFRLENPPVWAKYVMPLKWIDDWRRLSYGEVPEKDLDDKKLIRVAGVAAISVIFFGILSIL